MRTISIELRVPDLLRYLDIKFFLEKMIFNNTYNIVEIIGVKENELEEYHERQILNNGVKRIPGQPYWKNRRHTQATKDKISKSLKAKGWKGIKKIDTLEVLSDRKKEEINLAFREKYGTV
ncbi:hypothetical protein ES705_40703 [subsurface metagenome]